MTAPTTPPMHVGINVSTTDQDILLDELLPARPAFVSSFTPPGHRLPPVRTATTPYPVWYRHKDPYPIDVISDYWTDLPIIDPAQSAAGGHYRWTYHHEMAPASIADADDFHTYWLALIALKYRHPRGSQIELVNLQSDYAMRFRVDTRWQDWIVQGVTNGLDCYAPDFGSGYEPPESLFGLLTGIAARTGGPIAVGELGVEPRINANRSRWFSDCLAYLPTIGCTAVGLWYGSETRHGRHYDYRPDADTLNIWQKFMPITTNMWAGQNR